MKKLLFIPVWLVAFSITAQEHFTVPEIPVEKKYENMVWQTNAIVLNMISYAKTSGNNAEDAAIHMGNQFKTTWNKEEGFKGLVYGVLYNLVISNPAGQVTIEEQSADKVKIKAGNVFPYLYEQGKLFDVTYEEYSHHFEKVMEIIAGHLGTDIQMETQGNNWLITLARRKQLSGE